MAKQILSDYDFNSSSRLLNLLNAQSPQEPVTLAQFQAQIEGLAWKDNCRVQTQSNINLSAPGATIDGVTLATNDRVLVSSQTTAAQNGIYIWNGASTQMTRALDANLFSELLSAVTTIDEGTVGAGTTWRQTTVGGTLETSAVNWVPFGVVTPNATESVAGKIQIATQSQTDTGTDDTTAVTPKKLNTWASRPLRYQTLIGDGTNTSYTITHNLGTRDAMVQLYRNSGNYDQVDAEVRRTSTTQCTVVFASAPSSNQFRVVVTA